MAARLRAFLGATTMAYSAAGRALGVHPNSLRYGATTGTILLRWDGAGQPTVWTVPAPDVDPHEARLELARRYLRVFGPGTPESFARWAGIGPRQGLTTFHALRGSLLPVRTPIVDGWILDRDEATFRSDAGPAAPARLLPSGDAYCLLLHEAERGLLVPDPDRRRSLWPPRAWPGAVLVDGEIVGTWRRAVATVTVEPWRRLSRAARAAVEAEAASLPLAGEPGEIVVRWDR